jgi:hypothetical protein
MITIGNFTHRLGNQLFQIAAAHALAKQNNTELFCPEWEYQRYFKHQFRLYQKENVQNVFIEKGFHYTPIEFKDNLAISGYFQSYKYFTKEIIDEIFELKYPFSSHPLPDKYAAIHVRRGDYLKFPDHHPLCAKEYYKQAIVLSGYKKFTIYSDDIKWCRENFESYFGYEFSFSDSNNEMMDFQLMTGYKCLIISNSTFSWWAAMINKNPDKIIITPSKDNWHGIAYKDWNHDDLLPEEWKQIKF